MRTHLKTFLKSSWQPSQRVFTPPRAICLRSQPGIRSFLFYFLFFIRMRSQHYHNLSDRNSSAIPGRNDPGGSEQPSVIAHNLHVQNKASATPRVRVSVVRKKTFHRCWRAHGYQPWFVNFRLVLFHFQDFGIIFFYGTQTSVFGVFKEETGVVHSA